MTKESLIKQLETACYGLDPVDPLRLLVDDVIAALRENAMREVQRLGQEIEQEPVAVVDANDEGYWADILPDRNVKVGQLLYTTPPQQEPVAWLLTDKNINSLQVDSIQRLIDCLKHAHHTDLCVRINGQDEWFEADWLKHMVIVTPPQRTEPVAWINVEERKLEWAKPMSWNTPTTVNIPKIPLYTTPPQRTWVDLTDEEIDNINYTSAHMLAREVLAKLKEKNT